MKPDYKNWMPKGMILGFLGGAAAALVLCLFFGYSGLPAGGAMKTVLTVAFAALAAVTVTGPLASAYSAYRLSRIDTGRILREGD